MKELISKMKLHEIIDSSAKYARKDVVQDYIAQCERLKEDDTQNSSIEGNEYYVAAILTAQNICTQTVKKILERIFCS